MSTRKVNGVFITSLDGGGGNHSYLTIEKLRKYLYRVTFDTLPEDNGSNAPVMGACSAYVANGKLYRNYDFYYDNSASFIVKTNNFEGMSMITGLNDGHLDEAKIAQLPYRMVDGENNHGIMMSVHLLFNDWQYTGAGNKSIALTRLPFEVLSKVKSMATIAADLADVLGNLNVTEAMGDYLLQCLITDGTTTYALVPPTNDGEEYELIDATSYPKMANFRYVARAEVSRSDMDIQDRPTGIERFNAMPCALEDLRFTKCYESPDRLSEFIGINGTTKASTDAELTEIYNLARAEYLTRQRDGKTWQTVHSVVYGNKMESLWIQENWDDNIISYPGPEVEIERQRAMVAEAELDDRVADIEAKEEDWDAKYEKPLTGIPASDLEDGVIPDVSQFVTRTVNDLLNYYLKTETYTKIEVQALIDAVKQFTYEVVSVLPTATASTMHKIYLVPSSNPELANVKDEFITIDNGASAETRYTWEQIGSTAINLTNYHTIEQETAAINAAVAPFLSESQIQTLITSALASYRTSEQQDVIDETKANKDGYYQTLSAGYADKAGDLDIQTSAMVRHTQVKPMETTGGDKDVRDGQGFIRVIRGTENGITAAGAKIISLGFNLIPSGSGTTFTFECKRGEWGEYGTSQKNNGYLFSDSDNNILIPVSVKQNGVDVPTHTDHGNTYYLPPQDGQCTVVFAASQTNPCGHLCWSNGRDTKDNYEPYNASIVDLAPAINAIGGTLRRVGYVFDEINLETKQSIRRIGYRLLNVLSWTMEAGPTPEEGEATNTFRAIVSGGIATADTIKAGGAFAIKGLSGLTFNLDGTSLVCDSTIASVADFVTALGSGAIEYELAVEVVVTNTLNGQITISDYGIIIFENTAGASVVDIDFDFDTKWRDFIKNLPNDLDRMNNDRDSIKKEVASIHEDIDGIRDTAALPLLCGQPPVLYGAGAPAEAVVPDNWKQFDPATGEGYNWNGNPSAIGQRYINVSATNGGYTAGRKSLVKTSADYYVLKWYKD